jgi:hypothetical protein
MATKQKLDTFFESRRRRCTLESWQHLKNGANESRIKMNISMPMLNIPPTGAHATILNAFEAMEKDGSGIGRTKLEIFSEGMTMDFFVQDRTPGKLIAAEGNPVLSVLGVLLDKFQLVSEGAGETRTVSLDFVAYVPANEKLRNWCWDHIHADFFLEAVYSQSEMDFKEEEEEAGSDTEEEEEEVAF